MSPRARRDRRAASAGVAAVLCCLALLAVLRPDVGPAAVFGDFNAFYCAGAAAAAGADPYRAEPLGRCERTPQPAPFLRALPGLAVPAPLPPYALAPFVALARLPYPIAAVLWAGVLLGAFAITVAAMRRLTQLPVLGLAAVFALGDFSAGLCLGQIAPVAVAALCVAALLLERDRDGYAALAAALAAVEPHVGLPACLALFIGRPRTRAVLVSAALAAVSLSLAVAGPATTLEYVTAVVPAHALAEAVNEKQFSVTYVLTRFGLSPDAAVRDGGLWYAAMLVSGACLAGRLARTQSRAALLVAIPPAFAVFGGAFVHVVQLAAALPAALLLYGRAGRAGRCVLGSALLALAIPWIQFAPLGTLVVPLGALVAALVTAEFIDRRPAIAGAAALAAILFLTALKLAARTSPADPAPLLLAHYDPHALAEQSWMQYVAVVGTVDRLPFDLAKVPALAALVTILLAAIAAALPLHRSAECGNLSHGGNEADVLRRIALR